MDSTPSRLEVRKYPNRRFYDTTRSRHVTLSELHDLICSGSELTIVDSTSGQDITNVVLTQILVERDADKLGLFPSQVLHQIIRTQAGKLGSVFEAFVRQMVESQRTSQAQWSRFLQNTLGVSLPPVLSPLDWTQTMMSAMQSRAAPASNPASGPAEHGLEIDALRAQIANLNNRVEELSKVGSPAVRRRSTGTRRRPKSQRRPKS